MVALKWETPEETRGANSRFDWEPIAAALRNRPGEWAVVAENVSSTVATSIRHGRLKAFRDGAYQATARGTNQATGRVEKVYARYLGEKGSE